MGEGFRNSLKVERNKKIEQIESELDAYKDFVSIYMTGYIKIMEAINIIIAELERKGIIGKTELDGKDRGFKTKIKSRIKAAESSLINSQKKELDDIFGFEIITQNERDKEIVMLIIHNLLRKSNIQEKNHNKSNGYFAHHCIGEFKGSVSSEEIIGLESQILNSLTNELKPQYRDLPKKERQKLSKKELYHKVFRYPTLRDEVLKNGQINMDLEDEISRVLIVMEQFLNQDSNIKKDGMPIIEFQFKTLAVQKEIEFGKAHHNNYKKVDEDEKKEKYNQKKLIRGIHFPFVFCRNSNGNMELESTNKTLISMWPFLQESIEHYKKTHKKPLASYDMFLARVFPELEVYIEKLAQKEPCLSAKNFDSKRIWEVLKKKIINDDFVLQEYEEANKVIEV